MLARFFIPADRLLRVDLLDSPRGPALSSQTLFAILIAAGMFYGAVMGGFFVNAGPRPLQVLYSALKVPLLLLTTFGVSLPSFFVLNTLVGLRNDFPVALRALLATQAALTVVLASLAPLTALWYATSADYQTAILYNGLMFAVASFTAQFILRRLYRPLLVKDPRHRWMLRLWLVLFCFVGIQTAWVLRPFVGDPNAKVQFFRQDAWGNAYEFVARMIWHKLFH